MKNRTFIIGDSYRPVAHVMKVKKDIPTVLHISGRRYVLEHENNWKGKTK